MGYYIKTIRSSFYIHDEAGALAALRSLGNGKGHPRALGSSFMWMRNEDPSKATSVREALRMWMYDYDAQRRELRFMAEKIGDEDIMLRAIAPFVEAGSWVDMAGEDAYRWRWSFDGHRLSDVPTY